MGYELHTNLYRRWLASSVQYGFPVGLAAAWKCKTGRASGHLFSIISKSTSLQMESPGAESWQGWPHSASESYLTPQKWILLPAVGRRVTLSCCCSVSAQSHHEPAHTKFQGMECPPPPSQRQLICTNSSLLYQHWWSVAFSLLISSEIKIPKTSVTLPSSWANFSTCICIHHHQLQVCLAYFCCFTCRGKCLKVFTSHLYFATVPSKPTALLENVNESSNLPTACPSVSGYSVFTISARALL